MDLGIVLILLGLIFFLLLNHLIGLVLMLFGGALLLLNAIPRR